MPPLDAPPPEGAGRDVGTGEGATPGPAAAKAGVTPLIGAAVGVGAAVTASVAVGAGVAVATLAAARGGNAVAALAGIAVGERAGVGVGVAVEKRVGVRVGIPVGDAVAVRVGEGAATIQATELCLERREVNVIWYLAGASLDRAAERQTWFPTSETVLRSTSVPSR
jgi:hypothetical protein